MSDTWDIICLSSLENAGQQQLHHPIRCRCFGLSSLENAGQQQQRWA